MPCGPVEVLGTDLSVTTQADKVFLLGGAVVRLWQEPFEPLRGGSLGLLPLALLTDEAARDLGGAFREVDERLRQATSDPALVAALHSAAYFLLGLRYDEGTIRRLYGSATMLEESSTYQATLRKGEKLGEIRGAIGEAQRILLLLGRKHFGPISAAAEAALRGIDDRERLERMAERLLDVAGWDELLATP